MPQTEIGRFPVLQPLLQSFPREEGHHEAVAQLLLAPDVALDALSSGAKQRTALHLAAANGHAEVCGALLLQRASLGTHVKHIGTK